MSIDDKLRLASETANNSRKEIMANSEIRAKESFKRQIDEGNKANDELKRKIEELKNSTPNSNR